jgi:hypothetical protein
MSIDYEQIDPGVRKLVRWLNELGFETTDSGDGYSKSNLGYEDEDFLNFPHVAILCSKYEEPYYTANRLLEELMEAKLPVGHGTIQLSYDPFDKSSIILLIDIDDTDLNK